MNGFAALGAIGFGDDGGVARVEAQVVRMEGVFEREQAGVVPTEGGVAAEPADPAVAEAVKVADDLGQGLGLIAQNRVTEPAVVRRDGDHATREPGELGHEWKGHFAEDNDATDFMAGVQNLAELSGREFILGP